MSGKQKEEYVEMEKKLKDMGIELNELAIAMCDYIQTGQKMEQLSKFWDNEDSFYKAFEKELEKVMETLGKMEMKSMNFMDLSAKIEITEEQLDDILVHNIQYFNMHEREGRVKVSLSPLCRKILNFKKKEGGCKN